MKKIKEPNLREKLLPAQYISPWLFLRRDFKLILADIFFRFRVVLRRNREGEFSRPFFWPSKFAYAFWPIVLMGSILLIIFMFNCFFSLKSLDKSVPANKVTSLHSLLKTNINTTKFSEKEISDELKYKVQSQFEISQDNPPNSKILDSLRSMLEESRDLSFLSNEFLKSAVRTQSENSLLITVGTEWLDLSMTKKSDLANYLYLFLQDKGYLQLQIVDDSGHLLAKTSRIGKEIIIFEPQS